VLRVAYSPWVHESAQAWWLWPMGLVAMPRGCAGFGLASLRLE